MFFFYESYEDRVLVFGYCIVEPGEGSEAVAEGVAGEEDGIADDVWLCCMGFGGLTGLGFLCGGIHNGLIC